MEEPRIKLQACLTPKPMHITPYSRYFICHKEEANWSQMDQINLLSLLEKENKNLYVNGDLLLVLFFGREGRVALMETPNVKIECF